MVLLFAFHISGSLIQPVWEVLSRCKHSCRHQYMPELEACGPAPRPSSTTAVWHSHKPWVMWLCISMETRHSHNWTTAWLTRSSVSSVLPSACFVIVVGFFYCYQEQRTNRVLPVTSASCFPGLFSHVFSCHRDHKSQKMLCAQWGGPVSCWALCFM